MGGGKVYPEFVAEGVLWAMAGPGMVVVCLGTEGRAAHLEHLTSV